MPRYVAFLRGINVGGHRVKMDRLKDLFEELGFSDVSTFIASGNVVFGAPALDAATLETRIQDHLGAELGYDVATFIRSLSELQDVAACRPFTEVETAGPNHSLYVVFLKAPPDQDVRADIADLGTEMDELRVHGREIYWLIRGKLTESPVFGGELAKATKNAPTTTRNVKTLRRIMAKYAPGEGPGS